jgi:cytochrome c-type biogenesis protein CcmF
LIIETGHFALLLAFAVAVVQMGAAAWSAYAEDEAAIAVPSSAAMAQFGLLIVAFSALVWAYVTSDFSVENVWQNSHSASRSSIRFQVRGAITKDRCCSGC